MEKNIGTFKGKLKNFSTQKREEYLVKISFYKAALKLGKNKLVLNMNYTGHLVIKNCFFYFKIHADFMEV